ncbi:MAG: hypothetical protein ACRDT4_19645 [Micromonosporaceae bacterium]
MLTRRFQILLDEGQYDRVRAIAKQRRVSVATVIREAIDSGLPATDSARKKAAAKRILEAPDMDVPDVAELKRELDEIRGGGLL